MSEYTPTTDTVRDSYIEGSEHDCMYEGDVKLTPDGILTGREFDRWLLKVQEAAWNEGAAFAWSESTRKQYPDAEVKDFAPFSVRLQNPYSAQLYPNHYKGRLTNDT